MASKVYVYPYNVDKDGKGLYRACGEDGTILAEKYQDSFADASTYFDINSDYRAKFLEHYVLGYEVVPVTTLPQEVINRNDQLKPTGGK